MSPAAIHKIEKSGMTPTIASLMKIAAALGKSVSYFIDESEPLRPVTHIRAGERQLLYTSKQGLVLENVSGRYGPLRSGRRGDRRAARRQRAGADEPPRRGAGRPARGDDVFRVGGAQYDLEEGDSLHFRTTLPHTWSNPSDSPARAIWLAIRSS